MWFLYFESTIYQVFWNFMYKFDTLLPYAFFKQTNYLNFRGIMYHIFSKNILY